MNQKMPKLVVMIPCFNEEKTLPLVIKSIPKKIPGISRVEILIINDGSTDNTEKVAGKLKAHLVSHTQNQGLGVAFRNGLTRALELGADIIVNIDADMQFNPKDIPLLVKPILERKADMVTASRFYNRQVIPKNMPLTKKIGNWSFTRLVNFLTRRKFTDTQCGFRAYSREAALQLNVFNEFTYTQEVFIALVNKGMKIIEIPIKVKYFKERKAKVSASLFKYGVRALLIVIRTFRDYQPLLFFGIPGASLFSVGFMLTIFSFIYWIVTKRTTPIRMDFWVGSFLVTIGFLLIVLALIADMFKRMRRNQEEILYRLKTNK
jgi:glycosyltransferase involved in cell wall biosynthesis